MFYGNTLNCTIAYNIFYTGFTKNNHSQEQDGLYVITFITDCYLRNNKNKKNWTDCVEKFNMF